MSRTIRRDLAIESAIYVASVVLVISLWRAPEALLFGFLLVSALMFSKWHAKNDIVLYVVGVVCGTIVDLAAVPSGAWHYTETTWVIPAWLPIGWGIAALLLKKVSDTLTSAR